jgi:hypothetical protein
MYTECIIRVTFLERPVHESEFTIHSTIYLLGANLRKEFMNIMNIMNIRTYWKDGLFYKEDEYEPDRKYLYKYLMNKNNIIM